MRNTLPTVKHLIEALQLADLARLGGFAGG